MERNYSADTYGYYKEPINCQTNITYNEVYHQTTHAANNSIPYEAEYKDRRYAPSQNNVYYDGNYKTEANYKIDKNLQSYRPSAHSKHSTDLYKDNGYYSQYYDPYKLNANIPPVVNIQSQLPKPKDSYYHGAHATNQFPTSKIQSTYCDENVLQSSTKANLPKTSSCQVPPPQYMYSNCYNYPTSSGYSNQAGYCAYPPSCNDETKLYWDDYQNNRRLMQPTYSQPSLSQQNCSLKDNHTSLEYYKANNFSCQAESFHAREKPVYGVGSHSNSSEHLYNNRTSWPPSIQYQSMPPHLPNTLERSNYYHDTQNYDCCAVLPPTQPLPQPHHSYASVAHSLMPQQRQDNSANFYSNYGKYLQHPPSHSIPPQVNQLKYGRSQQHSPTASAPSALPNANIYNSQRYYMYNEQNSSMNSYQPNYPKDDCVQTQSIGSNLIYNLDTNETNVNVTYSIEDKNIIYKNYQPPQVDVNGAYGKPGYHPNLMNSVYQENQKNQLTRSQNLREFLSSWNEDEDDGCEKGDPTTQGTMSYPGSGLCGNGMSGISNGMLSGMEYDMNSMKTGTQVPGAANNSSAMENHLQFKSTFATRPKIHVGITVDSNVSNSQYINLPDIIIDIEKSKETESIQSTVELNTAPIAKLNEKTVLANPIDEPKTTENVENVVKEDCREVTLKTSTGTETSDLSVISESILEKTILQECDVPNEKAATIEDVETYLNQDHSKSFGIRNSKKMKKLTEAIKRKDNRHWKKKFKHVYALEKINLKRLAKFRKMKRMKLRSKALNIKKLQKKTRKDKCISQSSADRSFPVKTKKDQSSSLYNPDSLKTLCITTINTEEFRNLMMSLYELEITTYQEQDSIDLDAGPSVENYEEQYNVTMLTEDENYHNFNNVEANVSTHAADSSKVPKLSALCEYALKDVYEQNLFIINLDDENLSSSNNIYLVECDVNENITDFEEITHLTTSTLEESPQGINETATVEIVESLNDADTNDCNIIENNNNIHSINNNNNNINNNNNNNINNNNNNNNSCSLNNFTDTNNSDHILKDLSSIHHEEIVPENYELFKNQNLRNYLHNKYVQKTNFLQVIVINKILKKYQRYLMKKKRGKNFSKNFNKRLK